MSKFLNKHSSKRNSGKKEKEQIGSDADNTNAEKYYEEEYNAEGYNTEEYCTGKYDDSEHSSIHHHSEHETSRTSCTENAEKSSKNASKDVSEGESEGKASDKDSDSLKSSKVIIWMIVIVIALFVLAFFAGKIFYKPKKSDSYTYNGFVFTKIGSMWSTEVQLKDKIYIVPLHFGPRDVEHISYRGELNDSFYTDEIYITFDPKNDSELQYIAVSAAELSLNMVQALGYRPVAACTSDTTEACSQRPIIDCSTPDSSVIYIVDEGFPEIVFDNRCIIVRGNGMDVVKATDRLILQWYGVMNQPSIGYPLFT